MNCKHVIVYTILFFLVFTGTLFPGSSVRLSANPLKLRTGAPITFIINTSQPNGARFEIRIFDLAGREVITISGTIGTTPDYTVPDTWDGRNKSGKTVYSGIYIGHLTINDDKFKFRIGVLNK